MALVQTTSGKARELCLSWCRKKWFNCHDTERLFEVVVTASSLSARYDTQLRCSSMACVGRALYNSEWCPGYFCFDKQGSQGQLYLASLDYCSRCDDFELLTGTNLQSFRGNPYFWQPWQGSKQVPNDALIGGTRQGQPVYIARTLIDDYCVIGGFVPGIQMASFNYQMTLVQRNRDFDLLVMGCRISG